MIAMSLRTFIIKALVFLLSIKIRGRHSTTDIPYKKYTIECLKKQVNKNYFNRFLKMCVIILIVVGVNVNLFCWFLTKNYVGF